MGVDFKLTTKVAATFSILLLIRPILSTRPWQQMKRLDTWCCRSAAVQKQVTECQQSWYSAHDTEPPESAQLLCQLDGTVEGTSNATSYSRLLCSNGYTGWRGKGSAGSL